MVSAGDEKRVSRSKQSTRLIRRASRTAETNVLLVRPLHCVPMTVFSPESADGHTPAATAWRQVGARSHGFNFRDSWGSFAGLKS